MILWFLLLVSAHSVNTAEEENRHTVNKLLMLLGSNVTNRRERDARMQRCLQESGDAGSSERDGGVARRSTTNRRPRSMDSTSVDLGQLQAFWSGLPSSQRAELCRVPLQDLEQAVMTVVAASATRESSEGNTLLLQLLATLAQPCDEAEGSAEGSAECRAEDH